ncbi:AbiTii domain-containing protein [Agarivorans sp. MS3-6]
MSAPTISPSVISLLQAILQTVREHAHSLSIEDIDQWLEHELEGYGDFAHFPDYRIVECKLFGIFKKPGQELQHFEQIHDDCLNERDRCQLRYLHLQLSLSDCLSTEEEIQRAWPTRLLASYAEDIIPGYQCVRAWQSFHAPLNERLISGVLGHLIHLLLLSDNPKGAVLIAEVAEQCKQHPQLDLLWAKLYKDATSTA